MKNLIFFACMSAFFLLPGCSSDENPTPVELSATEKLIKKTWALTGFAIRTDTGGTYSMTQAQWQALGIGLDNLTFSKNGGFTSIGTSGTYIVKQDDTVLEMTSSTDYTYILIDLTVSDFRFNGNSPAVKVNPEEPNITEEGHGVALYGLAGLSVLNVVDVSTVKSVQLIFNYTGV